MTKRGRSSKPHEVVHANRKSRLSTEHQPSTEDVAAVATDITIDGSHGEGGGQVVRTAIAMAAVLRQSLTVLNVRSARPAPGLKAQHLTAVRFVADILSADLVGAHLASTAFALHNLSNASAPSAATAPPDTLPREAAVGTAGATALVLQAALPPALALLPSGCASSDAAPVHDMLVVSGGTSVPLAPTSDYMQLVLAPNLVHFGLHLHVRVERHGFFPAGGGRCAVSFGKSACIPSAASSSASGEGEGEDGEGGHVGEPSSCFLRACRLEARGRVLAFSGRVLVCGGAYGHAELGEHVRAAAHATLSRFTRSAADMPSLPADAIAVCGTGDGKQSHAQEKGLAVTLCAHTAAGTVLGASAVWSERGARALAADLGIPAVRPSAPRASVHRFWQVTAKRCGELAAEQLLDAVRSGAVVDPHMADQLPIFMAMASGTSRLLVSQPSMHLQSVIHVLRSFKVNISMEPAEDSACSMLVCEGRQVPLLP